MSTQKTIFEGDMRFVLNEQDNCATLHGLIMVGSNGKKVRERPLRGFPKDFIDTTEFGAVEEVGPGLAVFRHQPVGGETYDYEVFVSHEDWKIPD